MDLIAEIASLKSCIEEDVVVSERRVASMVEQYLEDSTIQFMSSDLDCQVTLRIEMCSSVRVEVVIPRNYPIMKPRVRLMGLVSRKAQSGINAQVEQLLADEALERETLLYDLLTLIRNNLLEQGSEADGNMSTVKSPVAELMPAVRESQDEYSRIMFVAHHLLASSKCKDIQHMTKELDIHAVSRIGYPGFIAAEGSCASINEFVRRIKNMRWHTIDLRYEVHHNLQNGETWKTQSLLSQQFLETTNMSEFAAQVECDHQWMKSVII